MFVLHSPSVGMAEDFVKEPQSWVQAQSQTAFILSLLMHSLAAGAGPCQRNPNGSVCSVILKLLPLQTWTPMSCSHPARKVVLMEKI